MPFSITTRDGITINNIPDDIDPTSDVLKQRVADIRARQAQTLQAQQPQAQIPTGRGIAGQRATAKREQLLANLSPEQRALIEDVGPFEAAAIGAGRGLTTIGRGLGLAEPEDPIVTEAIEALRAAQPTAVTGGEIAGEAAPFLLPGAGVGAIAGTAARVAATTALGAAEGAIIARGEGRDIGQQLFSAGIGGSVAGALELGLPIIGRIGGKIIRRALGKAPAGAVVDAAGNPSDELVRALRESGQTFDDVAREAQEELVGQVVDPQQAARKATLEAAGLDPTRAQITRNAADFQSQQEAAKTSSRVRDALEAQEAVLTSRFDNKILESGGEAVTPQSTVVDALTEKASVLDQQVSDLYRQAREVAPGAKNVRFSTLGGRLRKLAPSNEATGGAIKSIVGDLQSRGVLDKNMKVVGKIDVDTAEEVRKLMNELFDPQNPFRNGKLRELKEALDDDVFKAAGQDVFEAGRAAKRDFEQGLSRAKISKFDQRKNNLVRDVLENKIDPDKLVDTVVFGKKWRPEDLKQLKDYISDNPAGQKAFDDLRAETLQSIKDKSFFGPEDAAGNKALSRKKLSDALTSVGQKKMNLLFNPDEQKFLKDLLEVSKLREPVRGTALGRGPSAQAIGRLEAKLREIPILGSLVNIINVDAQGRVALRANPKRVTIPTVPLRERGALGQAIAPVRELLPAAAGVGAVAALPQEEQR